MEPFFGSFAKRVGKPLKEPKQEHLILRRKSTISGEALTGKEVPV